MAGMNTTPRPRMKWYQYSLRSLFVLTVLVAIAGSWFAVKKQQKERERAAVPAFQKACAGGVQAACACTGITGSTSQRRIGTNHARRNVCFLTLM